MGVGVGKGEATAWAGVGGAIVAEGRGMAVGLEFAGVFVVELAGREVKKETPPRTNRPMPAMTKTWGTQPGKRDIFIQ